MDTAMKKKLVIAAIAACLGYAPAYAAPYVSGSLGIGLPADAEFPSGNYPLDNSLVVNGAIGYNFGSARLEAAVGYQKHDYTDEPTWGGLEILTAMANAYYDFDTGSKVKPYIMAGAGIADVSTEDDYTNGTGFAWQLGAGIGFEVAKNVTFDLGYRYITAEDIDNLEGEMTWHAHNILAGIRYEF